MYQKIKGKKMNQKETKQVVETQESKEKLIAAMRIGAEMAKKEAKEKYTPKKFRNN